MNKGKMIMLGLVVVPSMCVGAVIGGFTTYKTLERNILRELEKARQERNDRRFSNTSYADWIRYKREKEKA